MADLGVFFEDEKVHTPTDQHRRRRERELGPLPVGGLAWAASLLAATAYLTVSSERVLEGLGRAMSEGLKAAGAGGDGLGVAWRLLVSASLTQMTPLLIVPVMGLAVVLLWRGRGALRLHGPKPRLSRLSPLEWSRECFSLNGPWRAVSGAFIAVAFMAAASVFLAATPDLPEARGEVLFGPGPSHALVVLALLATGFSLGGAWLEREAREKSLRMTYQEWKDSLKETEGSDELRRRKQRKQMEILHRPRRRAAGSEERGAS